MTSFAQVDPWKPYDNPGKKPPKPGIPEPSAYGLVFVALMLLTYMLFTGRKTRHGKKD